MVRRDLLLVAAVALAPRLFLAWAIPLGAGPGDPSRAPDEEHHMKVVRALAAGHPLLFPRDGVPHAAFLQTVYVPHAASLALLSAAGADRVWLYRYPLVRPDLAGFPLARAGSVLLGTLAVLLLALAAEALSGLRMVGLLAGLAAAVHPQLAFVSAYVNGDAFTAAAGAALALALARWARGGEGERGLLAVGVASGLVLLGKPNGYALLVPTTAWAASRLRAGLHPRSLFRAAALAAAIGAPFLLWNAFRSGGDALGSRSLGKWVKAHPALKDARALDASPADFAAAVARSSFAVLGNNDLELPAGWYRTAAVMVLLGLAGGGLAASRTGSVPRRAGAFLVGAFVVNAALLFHMSWFVEYQPQGRYLLLPSVLLVVAAVLSPAALGHGRLRWAWPAAGTIFLAAACAAACRLAIRQPFGP